MIWETVEARRGKKPIFKNTKGEKMQSKSGNSVWANVTLKNSAPFDKKRNAPWATVEVSAGETLMTEGLSAPEIAQASKQLQERCQERVGRLFVDNANAFFPDVFFDAEPAKLKDGKEG